jgi:hypothetical protein
LAPEPFNDAEQAMQVVLQTRSQQNPSTQKLLVHWEPDVHALPLAWSALQVLEGTSQ